MADPSTDERRSVRRQASKRYSRVVPLSVAPAHDGPGAPSSPRRGGSVSSSASDDRAAPGEGAGPSAVSSAGPSTGPSTGSGAGPAAPQPAPQAVTVTSGASSATSTPSPRLVDLKGAGRRAWFPPLSQLDPGGTNLLLRRLQKNKEKRSAQAQAESQAGLLELQQTFVARQPTLDATNWEFWAGVVGDYDAVARTQPDRLRQAIQGGFPNELRGLLWQVISASKSPAMEQLYASLVAVDDAPCLTAISKDVDRTSMARQVDRDALGRVLRAYSLFDPDVGYTQGMAFIAVPLLVNLSEVEAFCVFVQLMKTYDFRSMFMADMPGLHIKLYQFDRLVEDTLESVHTHLRRQGVLSSMYASQWFLTMFAYRFPLHLVLRIFDIVIAEGLEALLRFSLALMGAAADDILARSGIDELLPFLKEQIFDPFAGNENELVRLTSEVDLSPQLLSKYEIEHQELNRLEKERMEQMETLRASNARLSLQNRQLESSLEALNLEHVQIANKMVESGLTLAHLRHENEELQAKLSARNEEKQTYDELAAKLDALTRELAHVKHESSEMEQELALLRGSQDLVSTAGLLKRNRELEETNKRYEEQMGSLQESLASALEGSQ